MINYKWADIEPFFLSFSKANFKNCECIIWVYNIDEYTRNNINKYATIIDISEDFMKKMKKESFFITEYRHILYKDFLENNITKYKKVLLVDVRDVIFQNDIFKYSWDDNCLGVAEEPQTYAMDTVIGKVWIERKYGNKVYEEFKDNNIICAGTIIANINIMINLLDLLCKQIFSLKYFKNQDQADMNYIIFKKIFKYPLQISNNDTGVISTVGIEKNVLIKNDKILNYSGKIVSIIHQYDRLECIEKLVDKLYRSKYNADKRQSKLYYKKIEDIAKRYGREKIYHKWGVYFMKYIFYRTKYKVLYR